MTDEQARRQLTAAVARFRASAQQERLAAALRELGETERRLGNLAAALETYEEAVALCRLEGETRQLAHWIRHLGDVHLEAGWNEDGLRCCREALAIYRDLADAPPGDVANAVRSAALAHAECGLDQEALELFQEASRAYGLLGIEAGESEMSAQAGRAAARLEGSSEGNRPSR